MAFLLTIQGTVTDTRGAVVSGMTVELKNAAGSVRTTGTTNSSGFYSLSISSDNNPSGNYRADPLAKAPHWADPGSGTLFFWAAASNVTTTENFTSTFTNAIPTVGTIANQSYVDNSGTKFLDFTIADTDGDNLSVLKTTGPTWGTVSKLSNTAGRWTFDTNPPAPGAFTFGIKSYDGWDNSTIREFTVTITAVVVNNPPVLTPVPDIVHAQYSGTYVYPISATDTDAVTFSFASGPVGFTVYSSDTVPRTGEIRFNTAMGDLVTVGQYTYTVRATDTINQSVTDSGLINIIFGAGAFMSVVG